MNALLNGIVNMIANVYALLSVVPFASFVLLWFIVYAMSRDKKQATQRAMDVTAVLLVGCVSSMYYHIFQSSFGFFLIVFLLLVAYGLIGNMQYRSRGRIQHARLLQITLRIGFLGLSAMYVILLLIGTVKYYMVI